MIIIAFAILGLAIIAFGIIKRKKSSGDSAASNGELAVYYEMFNESLGSQMKQLVKAARVTIDNMTEIADSMDDIKYLHNEKIISDEYYNSFKDKEDNIEVEKIIIESEAESLKSGLKEAIFLEAKKLPSTRVTANKKKFFDESIYLKRKENLIKDLQIKLENKQD